MNIISEHSQLVTTEYGCYWLKYELLEYGAADEKDPEREGENGRYYGMRVCQVEERSRRLFDICQVRGITEEMEAAKSLFLKAVKGLVMPVSLQDFIDDWQTACSMVY